MEAGTLRSYRRAAAALALSLALTLPGAALPQSEAYLYGSDKTSIPAPAPYQVRAVYDGLELGVGRLREPQDLHVDKKRSKEIRTLLVEVVIVNVRDSTPFFISSSQ